MLDTVYNIYPDGEDSLPHAQPFPVSSAPVPAYQTVPMYGDPSYPIIELTESTLWADSTDLELATPVHVYADLTVQNSKVSAKYTFFGEMFRVFPGGSLKILNSHIVGKGQNIEADSGAILQIEGSELEGGSLSLGRRECRNCQL